MRPMGYDAFTAEHILAGHFIVDAPSDRYRFPDFVTWINFASVGRKGVPATRVIAPHVERTVTFEVSHPGNAFERGFSPHQVDCSAMASSSFCRVSAPLFARIHLRMFEPSPTALDIPCRTIWSSSNEENVRFICCVPGCPSWPVFGFLDQVKRPPPKTKSLKRRLRLYAVVKPFRGCEHAGGSGPDAIKRGKAIVFRGHEHRTD
jgi:hypothetical protein